MDLIFRGLLFAATGIFGLFGTLVSLCPLQGQDPAFYLFDSIRKAIAGAVPDTSVRLALLKENERAAEQFLSKAEEAGALEDKLMELEAEEVKSKGTVGSLSADAHKPVKAARLTGRNVRGPSN